MKDLYTNKYYPSLKLSNVIDLYWIIENKTNKIIDIPIVADGTMCIIYDNDDLFFCGSLDKGIIRQSKPDDTVFGIRFKPTILPHLVDIKANNFINKLIPLNDISNSLFEILNFKQVNVEKKVHILNSIFENLFQNIKINQELLFFTQEIIQNKGDISITNALKQYNISQKQIERLFKIYIGYTPKKFSNIIRFFNIFKNLIKTDSSNLSLKANTFGYYDQAHFNKEFKRFSNYNPKDEIMSIFYNTK